MSIKTDDLAELKSFIFDKGNILDLEDLKDHEKYARKQDECSDIKSQNTVKSVYVFRIHRRRIAAMEAYDSPKNAMIAVNVYAAILAALVLLFVFVGSGKMSMLPMLLGIIALYWFIGFIESAAKAGPYEDASEEEIELSKKCSELAPKLREADEKVTELKREAYMCYRDLNKMGRE